MTLYIIVFTTTDLFEKINSFQIISGESRSDNKMFIKKFIARWGNKGTNFQTGLTIDISGYKKFTEYGKVLNWVFDKLFNGKII
jgi:hypothetical protein